MELIQNNQNHHAQPYFASFGKQIPTLFAKQRRIVSIYFKKRNQLDHESGI